MKKILLLTLLLAFPALAEKLNLDNPLLVERFGISIIKDKLDSYDTDALSIWFLQKKYPSKWRKVKNDEFERDDAKAWAYEQFKKKLNKVEEIDKKAEYHLYLRASFSKYDFKGKRFPVKALSETSFMQYRGKGEFVSHYSSSKLLFDNIDENLNFINMDKKEAKAFIKTRKSRNGSVNRKMIAHYVFTIPKFKEIKEFNSAGSSMSIEFTGHLKYVEFMDGSRKNIFRKIDFSNIPTDNDLSK